MYKKSTTTPPPSWRQSSPPTKTRARPRKGAETAFANSTQGRKKEDEEEPKSAKAVVLVLSFAHEHNQANQSVSQSVNQTTYPAASRQPCTRHDDWPWIGFKGFFLVSGLGQYEEISCSEDFLSCFGDHIEPLRRELIWCCSGIFSFKDQAFLLFFFICIQNQNLT